jgi:peptide deformylase
MIYEIRYWPNPCLRKVAEDVTDFDLSHVNDLIANLFETMYTGHGMGLAATQCDINQRVLVIDTTQIGGKIKQAFINPVIKERTEKMIISEEGCLSFPGIFVKVERCDGVVVEHTTLTGDTEQAILNGVDAICFQHELEHLDGIVFYDHLKSAKRQMVETKVRKNVKKIMRLENKHAI